MSNVKLGVKALVAIGIIGAILFVAPTVGRFSPSHLIIQEVYCGSCHPEQVSELGSSGAHLAHFASGINGSYNKLTGGNLEAAMAITDGCTMCHNYWDNMKWFGVNNLAVTTYSVDNPTPITDIYGNQISPYGLSSTQAFLFRIGDKKGGPAAGLGGSGVEPWDAGLDVYQYTNGSGIVKTRVDYVWSKLSSLSPGPANFNSTGGGLPNSCGTAEKGLCHIAQNSIAQSEAGLRPEFPNNGSNGTNPGASRGSGVFFRHEMAYTTAQYAAKPVKLCGACHVFKLPPMTWGGEPWSQQVIEQAATTGILPVGGTIPTVINGHTGDPFGFTPLYPQSGTMSLDYTGHNQTFNVAFKTPDWAHQNVPCIRCHVHAGVNGETVSNNEITNT